MATLDELLDAYIDEQIDDDQYFVIDQNLRTITIPAGCEIAGVYHDSNVRIIPFKMPRYYSDIDLSTMSVSINYVNALDVEDKYTVTDLSFDEDCLTFTWLIGPNAFAKNGDLTFNVCLRKYTSDSTIDKEFNTIPTTLTVLDGLVVDSSAPSEKYTDIFNQWFTQWDDEIKESIQQIPDTVNDFWDNTFRDQVESDSQAYIDSKIQVISKEDYDALTEYKTGVVYLVTYGA